MTDARDAVDFRDSWPGLIEGDYAELVGYARILWPSFIEHDGCVFMAGRFTENNYQGFMRQTGGNKTAVESVMNHIHVLDLFSNAPSPSRELVRYLGQLIKETWTAKLLRDLPNRRFNVSFYPEGATSDLIQYEVTFSQER